MMSTQPDAKTDAKKPVATLYLWPQRTLYLGYIDPLTELSHGAHTLLLGLDKNIDVTIGNQIISGRSFLIPAGQTYSAELYEGRVSCCFLDALGRDLRFHQQQMTAQQSGIYLQSKHEESLIKALIDVHEQLLDANDTYHAIEGLLFPMDGAEVSGFKPDERISQVVDRIRQDPAENLSNEHLAEEVGLSGDRLQRLFKESTGIPIRRYRIWHRLFVTSTMISMGSSLTDAALAAGFSDSSHLTNAFRNMLGMSPSAVLRKSKHVRILAGLS